MNLVNFRYSPDPAVPQGTEPVETPEAKAARLEAELAVERKKVKDQNSYITTLEAKKNTTTPTNTPTPAPVNQTPTLSAAERYAISKATDEEVEKAVAKAKEVLGEEAAALVVEDIRSIARANIKDPFNVPAGIHDRVIEMAVGRGIVNKEKRVMIAGAYVKQQAPAAQPTNTTTVVESPSTSKIGTMQPNDRQGLGTNPINPPSTGEKTVSPRAAFENMKTKR